jgi:hypothetical protein
LASHHHRRARAGLIAIVLCAWSANAHAIRPFVTDDAHTVGEGHVQLETYWRRDRNSLQQWVLPAVGPVEWLEVTLGGVHGLNNLRSRPDPPVYSISGPLLQGKFLLHPTIPNRLPGVGVVVGGLSPLGRGGFQPPGWSSFSYVAVTQAFFKEDDFLIHMRLRPGEGHVGRRHADRDVLRLASDRRGLLRRPVRGRRRRRVSSRVPSDLQ